MGISKGITFSKLIFYKKARKFNIKGKVKVVPLECLIHIGNTFVYFVEKLIKGDSKIKQKQSYGIIR